MASCVINVGIFKALNTNRIYTSIDQNYLVDITKIIVFIHSFDIHGPVHLTILRFIMSSLLCISTNKINHFTMCSSLQLILVQGK